MPLAYLLDEHMSGPLWKAIQTHNSRGIELLDVVHVGDPPDLPRGSDDPAILLWCEREGRLLVSEDKSTMPGHLASHLSAGHHHPGIFIPKPRSTLPQLVDFLAAAAYGSDPAEWQDRIAFIPC